jgi:hypothetical protein
MKQEMPSATLSSSFILHPSSFILPVQPDAALTPLQIASAKILATGGSGAIW